MSFRGAIPKRKRTSGRSSFPPSKSACASVSEHVKDAHGTKECKQTTTTPIGQFEGPSDASINRRAKRSKTAGTDKYAESNKMTPKISTKIRPLSSSIETSFRHIKMDADTRAEYDEGNRRQNINGENVGTLSSTNASNELSLLNMKDQKNKMPVDIIPNENISHMLENLNISSSYFRGHQRRGSRCSRGNLSCRGTRWPKGIDEATKVLNASDFEVRNPDIHPEFKINPGEEKSFILDMHHDSTQCRKKRGKGRPGKDQKHVSESPVFIKNSIEDYYTEISCNYSKTLAGSLNKSLKGEISENSSSNESLNRYDFETMPHNCHKFNEIGAQNRVKIPQSRISPGEDNLHEIIDENLHEIIDENLVLDLSIRNPGETNSERENANEKEYVVKLEFETQSSEINSPYILQLQEENYQCESINETEYVVGKLESEVQCPVVNLPYNPQSEGENPDDAKAFSRSLVPIPESSYFSNNIIQGRFLTSVIREDIFYFPGNTVINFFCHDFSPMTPDVRRMHVYTQTYEVSRIANYPLNHHLISSADSYVANYYQVPSYASYLPNLYNYSYSSYSPNYYHALINTAYLPDYHFAPVDAPPYLPLFSLGPRNTCYS